MMVEPPDCVVLGDVGVRHGGDGVVAGVLSEVDVDHVDGLVRPVAGSGADVTVWTEGWSRRCFYGGLAAADCWRHLEPVACCTTAGLSASPVSWLGKGDNKIVVVDIVVDRGCWRS